MASLIKCSLVASQCKLICRSASYGFIRKYSSIESDVVRRDLDGDHEGITTIGFNRPKVLNAVNGNVVSELYTILNDIKYNNRVRVVILKSHNNGAFCVGGDLKERATMKQEDVGPFVKKARQATLDLENLPMPVIVAIEGLALGGGLEISLATDMIIAANSAKMGLTETKLAIIPGGGGTQRLPKFVGVQKAKELIFTGEAVDGEEAQRIGLANYCVAQNDDGDAAYQKALSIAAKIICNGPIGVRMAKLAIIRGMQVDIATGLTIEEGCYAQVIPTKDRMEALAAFKEKRKPLYKGY